MPLSSVSVGLHPRIGWMIHASSSRFAKLLALRTKEMRANPSSHLGHELWKGGWRVCWDARDKNPRASPRPPGPSVINLWNNKHKRLYNQWQILFLLWQNPSMELTFYRDKHVNELVNSPSPVRPRWLQPQPTPWRQPCERPLASGPSWARPRFLTQEKLR